MDDLLDDELGATVGRSRRDRKVLVVSGADTAGVTFPPGHPNDRGVYGAHPVVDHLYLPLADYNRRVFEHKVAEVQRLVTSLGADLVRVEHVAGWRHHGDSLAGSKTGVGFAPEFEVTKSSAEQKGARRIISELVLEPAPPYRLPRDLDWYPHEPLWVEVARSRTEHGLRSFSIDVDYTDDYGVNRDLKAGVERLGFHVAGSFVVHTSTTWRISGTFAPFDPQRASAG